MIFLGKDVAKIERRYADYFKIGRNAFEFVLDLGQSYAENGDVNLHTRTITSPNYGKVLLETLRESIQ